MGRSKKQQQQHQPENARDYSNKPNQLRKQQELSSSTSWRPSASTTSKLNAVMQMDPPGSRRRIARNPITDQHQQQDSLSPIPADADSSNDAAPSGGGAAGECRRSSRKKTIKFDVRDLLNKTRKNHKIQIEARIDSNAPTNKASGTGAASSRAELDSKQKNFIEKSAIFRRYSISENKLPPRPPPPPGALMHTIQQCVGELEQLPLAESGELNLAAISPIARRLSRTQDILTASMIKPKQVSSLIVTKLESASTAKAATSSTVVETKSMPTRRRVTERCEPSTSNAATAKNKQQKVVQRRGRKPKAKVFDEPTTKADLFSICNSSSPSSSIDGSFLRYATQIPAAENGNEPIETGNSSDPSDTSTTGIDLKENLDASAVTLPLPTIPADDCARNSTDESIAATEEDTFSIQNLSSDESIASSSKEMKANDEISLFGRSNSTDTTSSDSSEKRQRKIRIAVKRVSLTPQFLQSPSMSPHYPQSPQYPEHPQSPLGSSSEEPPPPENGDTVDLLSSTNDDVSNDRATAETSSSSISALKQLNENENKMPLAVPSCTTPPVAIDGDTTSVDSSVVEIVVGTTTIANSSVPKRRGRSKANKEQPPMDTLNTQEEFPLHINNRSSSARRQIHQQPTETITASIIPTKSREDVAQPLAKEVASSTASDDTSLIENPKPITPKSPSEETSPVKDDSGDSNSIANPKTRSLRSTQSNLESLPQLTLPTRQRKSNKVSSPVIEDPPAAENNAKTDVSPVLINSSQIEIESAQESIAEVKITRSRALKKKFNQGDPVLTDKNQTNPAKDGLSTSADKKETNISKPEGESTTDRSSADETASSDRRESPRLRSSASLAMTKLIPNKVFTAVSSSTPDSESSAESTDGRDKSSKTKTLKKSKPITNSEKVSEENSGMCSESSSITSSSTSTSSGSSTSSSSSISASDASSKSSAGTSSSTSSSSSGSSSSASSTFSEGRSTPSSKEEARKSPLKSAVLDRVKSSARSDSECSEKSSTSDDMRFKKLEKISQRRKTARLERLNRWSSEGSESSCSTVSRTRSGRSRGRLEDTNSQKNETSVVNETNESVPETPVENSAHATSQLRSKSKKRTRRFVPIKYSSSESGSLSDDGRKPPPAINVPSRMTRTRRKTISSASDFDELPSNNLSPPDLALEYLPRRSKLGMAKSQGDLSKIGTDDEAIKLDTKTRRSRSKKGIRNSSRCRSQSTAALKSDLTFKDTKGVQDINDYSQTASPTLSVSSYSSSSAEETQTKDLPQRKITRLSLKNQNSDSGNSESQTKKKNSDSNNDHVCQVMPTLVPDCLETIKDDGKDLEGKSKAGQIIVEPENSSSQIKNSESEASNSVKSSPKHKKTTKSIREKSGADAIDEASGICNEKDVELSVQSDPLKENVKDPPSDFRRITRFSPKNLEVATAEPKSNEQLVEKEEPEAIKKVTRSSLKRIEIIANSSPDAIKEKTSEPEDKDFVSIPDLSKEQVKISPKARKVGTNSPKSTEEQQKQVDEELQDLEITSPDLRSNATSCSTTNQQEEEPKQLDKVHSDDIENTLQEEPKQIPLESELVAGEQKVSSPKTKQSTPKQQEKEFKHVDSLQSDEKAIVAEQKTLTSLESAIQEPVSVESPKGKRQPTRAAAALKSPTKPKTEDKKEEPNAIDKTSDDLNSVPTIQTQENDQIIKVPRELRKTTRFSPRVPENSQTPQDESMVEKFSVENETEKKDIQLLSGSAELSEQEKTTKGAETNETLPTAVVEVSSDNRQIEKTLKDTNDDCQVREPGSSIEVQAVKTTRARKATRFSPLVSPTSIHEIKTKSTEIEVPQKVSEDQVFSTTEIPNSSLLPPVLKPQDSNRTADDVFPKRDAIEMPPSASNSTPPSKKSDYASKKVIKQQLQSMLDSLTLVGSNTTPPKETTPRRKKKTLTPVAAPPSSDSNQSDEPMKQTQQEPTQKIDQKPATPRRKLDSSFIESLEKSLLRSAKKASKKKEKDKAAIAQILTPTITAKEENTKKSTSPTNSTAQKPIEQCEELKKPVEAPSPKLKKKQPKESPKQNKKLEDQNLAKRKNLEKTKKSEESSFANIFKDVAVTSHPQPPKTKAETKFFSPGKSSIEYEPSSPPQLQPPVVQDVSPQLPVEVIKEKSPDLIPDPLKDIEKFIEDGVNLLKRTYKIDADDDTSLDRDILKPDDIMTPKKCKLDENVVETALTPTANSQGTSPRDDDNSNSNSECSNLTSLTNTSTSEIDTPNGIRRSHRIKNNSKSTKCLVGRGLVRERERFSTKDDEKTIYSIDDQKMDLAEVEAKNSKFLKDMEERLSNFRVIRENEYKCERVISKEAKRMLCDCFLTAEEEERGELGCGEDCLNRLLMIECGTDCTVRERCTNRRFNKFLYSPCRVFRTEKKGFGIMADIEILPGEFIMEYVGEVINGDEFEIRINEYSKDKNKHYYFMALRSDAVIDATAKGNISRFINHSCDPNAETQKWTVNGELRIGFFSRKSIMPGEEITFDYQYQRYGKEAQRCYCESSNCRGWIGAEPSSEEEEEEEVDEEDESEETEEEEPSGAVAPVLPVVPSPIPLDVAITDAEKNLTAPTLVAGAEVSAIPAAGEVDKPPQPVLDPSVPSPTPTTPAPPTPTVPDMLKPSTLLPKKTKKEKKRLHEEKLKRREPKQFLEDPDIEDEVRFLVKCGLRNQADTLRLSRLIVRAKLLETRIKLLQILRKAELPCRRLFLDYHGLRLLHGWMSEVIDTRNSEENLEIRMELLSVLECLPIPNKTMLNDSKVYYTVRDWSNNKESHSPSDRSPKESNLNSSDSPAQPMSTEVASSELQKLAAKLVHTWNNLPEVFRIPKRERIEQMKEHEREADRHYNRDDRDSSDRNRNRERFVSKNGKKGRFQWSKEKERDRANDRRKFAQNSSNSGKDSADKMASTLAGGDSHLSKEQRRELFAAKVARDEAEKRLAEERREFDIKCRFFGLDPKRIRPENMPFCVNPSTGQWFSTDKKPIATPPSYAHVQVPVKPKSTNPEDYRLPPMDLPPLWKFAISPKGKIYYYHVKIRIPQWEPPIKILPLSGQNDANAMKNSESDSSNTAPNESSEDDIEVIKGLDPVKLQAYIEKRIENRRLQRYTRLVEEKPISPRKEEDRIYNQMEVRKYKENKEKIRKRKEEIRKRRDIIGLPPAATVATVESSTSTNAAETTAKDGAEPLPIQDYLLSSEEEELLKAECNNSPLIDKIVQGDKIVDELDALHRKRSMKRALPIRDKYDHKKRKLDKNKESSKSTKRSKDGDGSGSSSSNSSKYRKVREKFRCEIAGIIVQHLKPYRGETCSNGRILTDDDFNHLARKLTHFVMVKELKYCESIGQTLIVTESVKNKSREFIKKYMAKYGKVYVRPKNDPEFKDIPFL